jgi:hypothetical protein
VIVSGTNFGPQTVVRIYKVGMTIPDFSVPTELLSSTQLVVYVDVQYPDSLGEWKVEVANPPPGGGYSRAISFFLTEGQFALNPFLISLNPTVVAAGGPSFALTINGTNFINGAQIQFNASLLATTVISDKQVRAEVPAALIETAGRVPVRLINPDNGGASNRLYMDIR